MASIGAMKFGADGKMAIVDKIFESFKETIDKLEKASSDLLVYKNKNANEIIGLEAKNKEYDEVIIKARKLQNNLLKLIS